MSIKVGIIGSTGYAGEFLVRILSKHPEVEITYLSSAHSAGKKLSNVLPALAGIADYPLQKEDIERISQSCECVFIAKKSVESMKYAPMLLKQGIKVIDIGGEFRLKDARQYEKWYGNAHTSPELLERSVYGLCELNREKIKKAELVANPGCYSTASILSLYPFVQTMKQSIASINISASSGVTGAGRTISSTEKNLFVNCFNDHSAYSVGTHKHTPEIEQEISFPVTFVPQLASMDRGILTVVYINIKTGSGPLGDPIEVLQEQYADEDFIRIFNTIDEVTASNVRGTNFCDISAVYVERTSTVAVVSAIDNLIKGASGQAVQNMNIMYGLDEETVLWGGCF